MDDAQNAPVYLKLSAKTSTFLSIDVVGSTALKSGQNQQDIIYTFLSYHKLVSQCAYMCHGNVMTISGDGMMCRFEKPEDALQATHDILEEIPTFNKRQNRLGQAFEIRVGVHTGDVMETDAMKSGQIISHTVDLAAKLQQTAPANHARISEATADQVKNTPMMLKKVGWDAKLQLNVYDYSNASATPAVKRIPPNPIKILLVDDELDQTMVLKKILWARRYDPFPVFTIDQARLALVGWGPHIIIVSADLPWNHGWELVRALRQDAKTANLPLIVMSHETKGDMIEKYYRAGVNGFLTKPLEEGPIQKRVESVVREFYL